MKVLHIGWGFRPWRSGGLIEYAEDLMDIQSDHGWNIFYFFSGRHYPLIKKSRLIQWKKRKIKMFEIINSPIVNGGEKGTIYPQMDLEEKISENLFRKVLEKTKPNIIHIHELLYLPSSLINIIKEEYRIPLVMTLHDYFLLCPTLKLFYDNENCLEAQVGEKCAVCCSNAPQNNKFLVLNTFDFTLNKYGILNLVQKTYPFLRKFINLKNKNENSIEKENIVNHKELSNIYQKRRDTNIDRLKKIDLLISQSNRVEKIYKKFLKSDNILTLHSTVKHIELIKPKTISGKHPINFATLNGCSSIPKGSKVIQKAVKILNSKGLNQYFNLYVWGSLDEEVLDIFEFRNINYCGTYDVKNINKILKNVDVGILPSVWEEVYGYTGIEFLAKGIPVIGNKKGGITDYTTDNFTGWLNRTCFGEELADIVEKIIKNPQKINDLNKNIIENRKPLTMEEHFNDIKGLYHKVIKKRWNKDV